MSLRRSTTGSTIREDHLAAAAGLYALMNLALAVALIATQPDRAADLRLMYSWCEGWLRRGLRLYSLPAENVDYPPHAIVLLSPMALLSQAALVPLWAAFNAILTPIAAVLVARVSASRVALRRLWLPAALFLCWGGVRMLLQFTRLSLALAFGSLWLADSRPMASGVLLGLALFKPHIAGPIALWMLCTRRFRPLAAAATVVAAGSAVYVVRAGTDPIATLGGYWTNLFSIYGRAEDLIGRTGFRVWTSALPGGPAAANAAWLIGSILLLAVPCRVAVANPDWRTTRAGAAAPGLFCLWSLMAWFHLGNNLVLMFPAFVFLLLVDDPVTSVQRRVICAALQLSLMIDVPVNLAGLASSLGPAGFVVRDFDRLAVPATFAYLAWLAARCARDDQKPGVRLNWNTQPCAGRRNGFAISN